MNTLAANPIVSLHRHAVRLHRGRVLLDWLPLLVGPAVVYLALAERTAAWQLMWLIAAAIYFGFKWLTWRQTRRSNATAGSKIAWWLAWVGMDAGRFLGTRRLLNKPLVTRREWRDAAVKTLGGLGLLACGVYCVDVDWPWTGALVGMTGVVMTLHFGLFHLLSCAWRAIGREAQPIMDRPLAATSVGEFWGRRWNRAFRDAAFLAVFQPMLRRFGGRAAMWAVFLFSGVVHDVVISLSAGAGFGLPTLYFLLQAAAISLEKTTAARRVGLGIGWRGRLFAALCIAAPAPLLFHPPFIERVVLPMLRILG